MADRTKPTKSRRRRRAHAMQSEGAAAVPVPLDEALNNERIHLMQIEAMLRCLYEVLLYADDDDTLFHADVANVAARLIDDSVTRLDVLRMSLPPLPEGLAVAF